MKKLSTGILLIIVIGFSSCKAKKELAAAKEDIQKLTTDLSGCNTSLTNSTNASNAKIADLTGQVNNLNTQNAQLNKDAMAFREIKADLTARQAMLNAELAAQGTSMREIREKIIAGLSALADSGIDVAFSNGLLYVALPENLDPQRLGGA